VNETPTDQFDKDKPLWYEVPKLKETNLGDETSSKNILVGDNWNLLLKAITFKIFLEYKDVFAWTNKDLKGVPSELCILRVPLESRVQLV
jgi:hypothetical protein